ncbi:hypothetical protein BS78_03G102900 [Paspalum vaginatum]|nr:hypothetical protein BS78_03G102900 [Paspalum vaginatum]
MKSSMWEHSLIIESDNNDDEHTQSQWAATATSRTRRHQEEQEEGSSSSFCATPCDPATTSYTQQWPQSYRQSIDIQ